MTQDLAPWLLEQIAEDEHVAGELAADGWPKHDGRVLSVEGTLPAPWPDRWNPVRVLAECDAKRQIIALVQLDFNDGEPICLGGYGEAYWDTLRLLALPYAARPGYREEWRP